MTICQSLSKIDNSESFRLKFHDSSEVELIRENKVNTEVIYVRHNSNFFKSLKEAGQYLDPTKKYTETQSNHQTNVISHLIMIR